MGGRVFAPGAAERIEKAQRRAAEKADRRKRLLDAARALDVLDAKALSRLAKRFTMNEGNVRAVLVEEGLLP